VASRDEILADVAIDTFLWFELVDDDTLHPDTAVGMIESCAAAFGRLDPSDRRWLHERVSARAVGDSDPAAKQALEALAEFLLDD
jgi:hypothetical protein